MKKIHLLILFLFLSSAIMLAQQKKYVAYTVKKGETIKSIAKVYKLSKRDLLRLNPGVSRKPKSNTIIIVPNINFGKKVVEIKKPSDRLYTVKPKETLFGISKKYGITIEELKAVNPDLINGVKIGMKLVIPKPSITQLKDSVNFVLHTVIIDDTLYNLSKRYEVEEEALFMLNPELSEGLRLGMLLKIKSIEAFKERTDVFIENIDVSKALNVVLMLPYQLNKLTDTLTIESFEKRNSLLNITTDFHLGAAMAIDSLKQKGIRINVTYLDTENSNFKLQYLVNTANFNDYDVVIGPLFFDKAHWVAKHINIPVVAPLFSKKQAALSANNLVKTSPNIKVYENKLLKHLEETYDGENILIVNDEKSANQSKLWRIVNKLKAFDSIQNIEVVKTENGIIDNELFKEKLDTLGKNWVVIISDEEVTTSAAVNNLKTFVADIDIRLFAINKGKNFDKIDNSFLGKLKFVFPTSEYMDIEDVKVKQFYKKYNAKNFAFPTKYAIRGFDVTYDALIRVASATNFEKGLQAGQSSRVASFFYYDKKLFGSFENKKVFLIQYTKDLNTIIFE
jgi:LysM repeat protein